MRFSTFGDYMFQLLIAPFKRGKRAVNQFYIFFKVIGRIFDSMKAGAFRLRDEVNIASASHAMLASHGQDRGMVRFEGEDPELYRNRLLMKGIVSEQAGTAQGIVSLIQSMGYETVYIEPYFLTESARWSEAVAWISGGAVVIEDLDIILAEVNKIKPGTSKITLSQEQIFRGQVFVGSATEIFKTIDIGQV
jgi:hypothetical protein